MNKYFLKNCQLVLQIRTKDETRKKKKKKKRKKTEEEEKKTNYCYSQLTMGGRTQPLKEMHVHTKAV